MDLFVWNNPHDINGIIFAIAYNVREAREKIFQNYSKTLTNTVGLAQLIQELSKCPRRFILRSFKENYLDSAVLDNFCEDFGITKEQLAIVRCYF